MKQQAFFILVSLLWAYLSAHNCIHDTIATPPVVIPQQYVSTPTFHQQPSTGLTGERNLGATAPFRLTLETLYLQDGQDAGNVCTTPGEVVTVPGDTFTCGENDVFTPEKRAFLENTILAQAEERMESFLNTFPLATLDLSNVSDTQCGVPIPPAYQNNGTTGVDMVIFVTARPILSMNTIAVARACVQGGCPGLSEFRRPIAGIANFDPEFINPNGDVNNIEQQIITAMHEITHALGFSFSTFSDFYDPATNSRRSPLTFVQFQNRDIPFLVGPTIAQMVQQHFDCMDNSSLPGAEIERGQNPVPQENFTPDGTVGSHFEKRVFYSEAMQGSTTQQATFSQMTLAVLQDSNWYTANFDSPFLQPFRWGVGLGCDFAAPGLPGTPQGCSPGGSFDSEGYSCNDPPTTVRCNFDRSARGICQTGSGTVNSEFQNSPLGIDSLADFCPIIVAASNGACNIAGNNPGVLEGDPLRRGETYGSPESRCFTSDLNEGEVGVNIAAPQPVDTCYVARCASETDLRVRVGGTNFYRCPPGGQVAAQDFGGRLRCPSDPRQVCVGMPDVTTEWPVFTSISPSSGSQGDRVTIMGENFVAGTRAEVAGSNCQDPVVTPPNQITCTVGTNGQINSLFGAPSSVAVINPNGNSDTAVNEFTLNQSIEDFANDIEQFIVQNPAAFVGIVVGILCLCLCCIGCCYYEFKGQKKNKKSPTAKMARSSMKSVKKLTVGRKQGKELVW